jgi:hypothetical protein
MEMKFRHYRDGLWAMRYGVEDGVASVEEMLFGGPMKGEAAGTKVLLLFLLTQACDDGSWGGTRFDLLDDACISSDELVAGMPRLIEMGVLEEFEIIPGRRGVRFVPGALDTLFPVEAGYEGDEEDKDAVV